MREPTVASVMTSPVITVTPDTSFKDIVTLLADKKISAVPVVDERGHPLGVVSEADTGNVTEGPITDGQAAMAGVAVALGLWVSAAAALCVIFLLARAGLNRARIRGMATGVGPCRTELDPQHLTGRRPKSLPSKARSR